MKKDEENSIISPFFQPPEVAEQAAKEIVERELGKHNVDDLGHPVLNHVDMQRISDITNELIAVLEKHKIKNVLCVFTTKGQSGGTISSGISHFDESPREQERLIEYLNAMLHNLLREWKNKS
jgi:hypothetical protein